ncbi:amidase signature enzyme [Amniculicola lignicola CBS 123094]|uniref:Amidase signature enzyme n=1 Tax=Amniculicola lignicola CBS 123094 TaxID=1392246 RepID=A0A6A5WS63_9PLEO|nr:amidase signature enzyme [Amniculicola lignicola CBS 123094]
MGICQALGAVVVSLLHNVHAAVRSSGATVYLEDVPYFLPPDVVGTLSVTRELRGALTKSPYVPFTVIQTEAHGFNTADLSAVTANYTLVDDVFQEAFLEAIYIHNLVNGTMGASQVHLGNHSNVIISSTCSETLKPGPYFLNTMGQVFEAWRLYSDTNGGFTESTIVNKAGEHSILPAGILGQQKAIAVPSRLYFTKTVEKPLAGVRIGIKDLYDIKGLRTSNGNRAWYWLYPPANATATPVQNLINAGAIIVGKQIMSQFANGETATTDWVDYHEAFNPRGDGYQDTSSSSSGAGASTGAYPWLDVSLGSDTGGSVRGPAQVQGVYGNRPSTGIVVLDHTMSMSPVLDTAGLLARDPLIWIAAAKAMYGENLTMTNSYPSQVTTFDWPTEADSVADTLLIDFLANITNFLSANSTEVNITAEWTEDYPSMDPLSIFLNITYPILIAKQQMPLVRDPFYRDYAAKYDGRRPFVDPVPLLRWGWATNNSATVDEAVANKTMFMNWWKSTVLIPDEETCSQSIGMYVGSSGSTLYRNQYLSPPVPPYGYGLWGVAGFTENPDIVVPIGEAPYNSTITGHIEYLPVTVDFMAPKGCDGMLFSLVEDLYNAGLIKTALAGRSGITGGEILFKRDINM